MDVCSVNPNAPGKRMDLSLPPPSKIAGMTRLCSLSNIISLRELTDHGIFNTSSSK